MAKIKQKDDDYKEAETWLSQDLIINPIKYLADNEVSTQCVSRSRECGHQLITYRTLIIHHLKFQNMDKHLFYVCGSFFDSEDNSQTENAMMLLTKIFPNLNLKINKGINNPFTTFDLISGQPKI